MTITETNLKGKGDFEDIKEKERNSSLWWYLWAAVTAVLEPDLLLGLLYNGKYNWLNLFEPNFSVTCV